MVWKLFHHQRYLSCCRNPSSYSLTLGDHNRNSNEGTEQTIRASRVIKHPQYRGSNNDIALLKLSRPARINDRVSPACLPEANYIVPPGTTCYITGEWSDQRPVSRKSRKLFGSEKPFLKLRPAYSSF